MLMHEGRLTTDSTVRPLVKRPRGNRAAVAGQQEQTSIHKDPNGNTCTEDSIEERSQRRSSSYWRMWRREKLTLIADNQSFAIL